MPFRRPPSGPLRIIGTPVQGQLLVALPVQGSTSTYQWQVGDGASVWNDISGQTTLQHVIAAGEAGSYERINELRGGFVRHSSPFGPIVGPRRALVSYANITIDTVAVAPRAARVTEANVTVG